MTEKKKISLAEAMKQKLAQKQEEQANGNQSKGHLSNTKKLTSQSTQKAKSMRRKMGS